MHVVSPLCQPAVFRHIHGEGFELWITDSNKGQASGLLGGLSELAPVKIQHPGGAVEKKTSGGARENSDQVYVETTPFFLIKIFPSLFVALNKIGRHFDQETGRQSPSQWRRCY
ncbi:hypothetical protein B0H13DRAFT_1855026 [Mycena leptocephala]|nr:hypothetical protein B0H13DRAFT_1855026 [Mycena leptocephala]